MREHPFGPAAAAHVAAQKVRETLIPELIRQNRAALDQCTGQPSCPASLHHKDCWATR